MSIVLEIPTYRDQYGERISCSDWYKTHDSAKPFRDRIMKAINQLRFKGLWYEIVNEEWEDIDFSSPDERLYRFVCDVRKLAGMPRMSRETYLEGRLYRHIFAGDYKYGLDEMWLLCWDDW